MVVSSLGRDGKVLSDGRFQTGKFFLALYIGKAAKAALW